MTHNRLQRLWYWTLLAGVGSGYVLRHPVTVLQSSVDDNLTSSMPVPFVLQRRDVDPADFGWIKRWAAIGDSFTAGIGAGTQLGKIWHNTDNWLCSRYDQAYPMVLNAAFGQAVEKFQYVACSGDRSEGIYKQVTEQLDSNLNLVIMTAGGIHDKEMRIPAVSNHRYDGESVCQEVITKAQENIDTILKPNLKSILLALNDKMDEDSVVVYNGYAQFFNTDDEDTCTTKQSWGWRRIFFSQWTRTALPLDIARRKRFNDLVIGINNAIKEVISDVQDNGNVKYRLGFANWDKWAYEGVRGQYCDPKGQGYYPDPDNQPDLQFFKPDTHYYPEHTELKRRENELGQGTYFPTQEEVWEHNELLNRERQDMYNSLLWKSANPSAAALHRLNPRDTPSPPDCPGDGGFDPTLGLGLPDSFGKNFHPNELGHRTIASFAVDRMIKLRAEVLGEDPTCKKADSFRCWGDEGSHSYANGDRMNIDYKDFCDNKVKQPEHTVGWEHTEPYNQDTPDEYSMTVSLSEKAADFDKNVCRESFEKIINSCDGWGEKPVNWRAGGLWQRGEYTYRIDIKRSNRPWPPPEKAHGDCDSQYKLVLSSFFLHGGGWSTWDHGQETLKKAVGSCIGSTPTSWKFWYYDEPDENGNEWSSSFNTPIWVRARCFGDDQVQKAAGGLTSGCKGSG